MLALEPFYNTVKKPKKTPAHTDEGDVAANTHGGCIKRVFLINNYRYVYKEYIVIPGGGMMAPWLVC